MKRIKKFLLSMVTAIGCGIIAMIPMTAHGEELTGKSAMEITAEMGKGFNIGNTLESTGGTNGDIASQEKSWGNPQINQDLVDGIKEAGFKTVRIPITWNRNISSDGSYTINEEYMNRIKEVVDYCYNDDLYVIINVHHEAWVNRKDYADAQKEIGAELAAVWAQIADAFADYDQHLIFEGMNEPRAAGQSYEWTGTNECYDVTNALDQIFVETVRKNGKGYNNERALMIPGYAASNSALVLRSIEIPTIKGEPAENVIISVHCYSPYNFCLSDAQETFNEANTSDTSDIRRMLKDLDELFLQNGIAVVIGECGCTNTNNNNSEREEWFAYIGRMTSEYGIPAIVWDNGANGTSGGECHNYFNRKTGEQAYPRLIKAFLTGEVDVVPEVLTDSVIDFEPIKQDGETKLIIPSDVGFTYSKLNAQMKVNHTEGATVGFALKVDSTIPDQLAALDIRQYGGSKIHVTAWVTSQEDSSVFAGIQNDSLNEMVNLSTVANEWGEVSFYYEVPEKTEAYLYFQGVEGVTFYVDDIQISLVDEIPVETETADTPEAEEISAEDTNSSEEATTPAEVVATEPAKKSIHWIVWVILGACAVIICAVVFVARKKNTKE